MRRQAMAVAAVKRTADHRHSSTRRVFDLVLNVLRFEPANPFRKSV